MTGYYSVAEKRRIEDSMAVTPAFKKPRNELALAVGSVERAVQISVRAQKFSIRLFYDFGAAICNCVLVSNVLIPI